MVRFETSICKEPGLLSQKSIERSKWGLTFYIILNSRTSKYKKENTTKNIMETKIFYLTYVWTCSYLFRMLVNCNCKLVTLSILKYIKVRQVLRGNGNCQKDIFITEMHCPNCKSKLQILSQLENICLCVLIMQWRIQTKSGHRTFRRNKQESREWGALVGDQKAPQFF